MDSKLLFTRVLEQVTECVLTADVKEFGNATPCSEWNLGQLLNHMVYELLWIPDLLAGKTVAEIGSKYDGDVLGDRPQSSWQDASDAAQEAVSRADLQAPVRLSGGDKTADEYIAEMAMEILVHGWDVSQALNYSLVFDPGIAQAVYDNTLPRKGQLQADGSVGPEIKVPDDAPVEVKLLGIMGRSVSNT
jgi:uncharacterized protein (TIGR03086 family)